MSNKISPTVGSKHKLTLPCWFIPVCRVQNIERWCDGVMFSEKPHMKNVGSRWNRFTSGTTEIFHSTLNRTAISVRCYSFTLLYAYLDGMFVSSAKMSIKFLSQSLGLLKLNFKNFTWICKKNHVIMYYGNVAVCSFTLLDYTLSSFYQFGFSWFSFHSLWAWRDFSSHFTKLNRWKQLVLILNRFLVSFRRRSLGSLFCNFGNALICGEISLILMWSYKIRSHDKRWINSGRFLCLINSYM